MFLSTVTFFQPIAASIRSYPISPPAGAVENVYQSGMGEGIPLSISFCKQKSMIPAYKTYEYKRSVQKRKFNGC